MEQNTIKDIIDTEVAIKKMLEEERNRASQWLSRIRVETEKNEQDEINRLDESTRGAKEQAQKTAENRAEKTIQDAVSMGRRLEALSDHHLQQTVWQHIGCIVPRTENDRQNVQN